MEKAEVRLLDAAHVDQVIASASPDSDGHFVMPRLKPGKYILSARSGGLIPASVDVEITRTGRGSPKRLILVILSADATRECGGASIKLQSKAEMDHFMAHAKTTFP